MMRAPMARTSGTKLGPYEIQSAIGGGMGEVYRARDTRLNRDVAIKILPASFSEYHGRRRRIPHRLLSRRQGCTGRIAGPPAQDCAGRSRDQAARAVEGNRSDPAGVQNVVSIRFSADQKAYAYSILRVLSDLYVVDGLK